MQQLYYSFLILTSILCPQSSVFSFTPISLKYPRRPLTSVVFDSKADRETEIRRKIIQLKKAGKIKKEIVDEVQAEIDQDDDNDNDLSPLEKIQRQRLRLKKASSVLDDYESAIKEKLGNKKAAYLGLDDSDEDPMEVLSEVKQEPQRRGQLGSLRPTFTEESKPVTAQLNILDPSLIENSKEEEDDDDAIEPELNEQELVDLVDRKLKEKRAREREQQEAEQAEKIAIIAQRSREAGTGTEVVPPSTTTTGIGGSWAKNETAEEESYRPSRGSWGYFERPKDISKAFGGGRRVGAGYTKEADVRLSEEMTKMRLREYREKVGIDVQSEKDHAEEIEEALRIARLAMERGVYNTAVSSLEKVSQWCSSNSRVGGNVYLELAMAYEANGQTDEAISIYQALTKCRIEDIKLNAKKLLYGIEAFQFMRDEAKSEAFNRKKSKNAFIDTTGNALAHFADNFDDVYRTGYVDINSGFYRKLSENVVRTNREARQILLRATVPGEVNRLKIVQALRSLSRHFDEALEKEIERTAPAKEPVAFLDGKPIVIKKKVQEVQIAGVDDFVLASPSQMIENLNGEWRLQLLADKKGDGVKFYDNTISWQNLDTNLMSFSSGSPAGFIPIAESGGLEFQEEKRILVRCNVESSSALLSGLFPNVGATSSIIPQQIVSVDSVLLITRCIPGNKRLLDEVKEYFAVWRKVEAGTFSKGNTR